MSLIKKNNMKTKIEELEQTINLAKLQIDELKRNKTTKTLCWYVEKYISNNITIFSVGKMKSLRDHVFNYEDASLIYDLIVNDLNDDLELDFTEFDRIALTYPILSF